MVLLLHEWKRELKTLLIWTVAISAFMMICVFLFPEMKGMMGSPLPVYHFELPLA